jgi:hypothetical protein
VEFVQIIEYQTSKPDEIQKLGEDFQASQGGAGASDVRVVAVKDRDKENTYMIIARFPSYEVAMENSQRPETSEMAGKMAALCDGPPTFRNLDVLSDM